MSLSRHKKFIFIFTCFLRRCLIRIKYSFHVTILFLIFVLVSCSSPNNFSLCLWAMLCNLIYELYRSLLTSPGVIVSSILICFNRLQKEIPISAYYPLYHTSYDTFMNVERYVDPSFSFHKMLSQFFSELLRNLADSVMIPFVTNDYAIRLQEVYQKLDDATRERLTAKNLTKSLSKWFLIYRNSYKNGTYWAILMDDDSFLAHDSWAGKQCLYDLSLPTLQGTC